MAEQSPLQEMALDRERLRRVAGTLEPGASSDGATLSDLNRWLGQHVGQRRAADRPVVMAALSQAEAALPPEITGVAEAGTLAEAGDVTATGCLDLGQLLTADQIRDIHEHLRSKPLLVSHVPEHASGTVSSLDEIPNDKNYGCYSYLDLWSAPHLIEHATRERFIDLAQGYLGCVPTFYSLNAFWSLPGRRPHPYSQIFHRDWEDFRSLVFFSQLTDVDRPQEGAHYYAESSHDAELLERSLRADGVGTNVNLLVEGPFIAPLAMRLFRRTARRFMGPAGTSFASDGYGLHRALVPRTQPRLLLWVRFGTFFNETMVRMPEGRDERARSILARIPDTPRQRYAFRYMIDALARAAS